MSLLEVGEALDEFALWMLRLGVLLALCFRGGADESLHAYLALHWEGSIDQMTGQYQIMFLGRNAEDYKISTITYNILPPSQITCLRFV